MDAFPIAIYENIMRADDPETEKFPNFAAVSS
jgi:hypothetical protein